MNGLNRHILVVLAMFHTLPAYGGELFHNGGTGQCTGCHTSPPELKGSDASSTCLMCHQAPLGVQLPRSPYVATDIRTGGLCLQLPPGGDFCWLKKNYQWNPSGISSRETSDGQRHGHNIVALDFNFDRDTSLMTAPGGSFPAADLTCTSCHDPHGYFRRNADGSIGTDGPPIVASGSYSTSPDPNANASVGSYRMLAGKGYQPKSRGGGYRFMSDPPAAVAPPDYNRSEQVSDTRVAYGTGMSEWCGNCHAGLVSNTNGEGKHISGSKALLSAEIIENYNAYVAGRSLKASSATSYTSMVPFEMGSADYGLLKRVANSNNLDRSGPSSGATVMCLTCHRAHASGWDSAMRWNSRSTYIVYEGRYPGAESAPAEYAQGRLEAEVTKTFYDRDPGGYGWFQRSLCNKCHIKD